MSAGFGAWVSVVILLRRVMCCSFSASFCVSVKFPSNTFNSAPFIEGCCDYFTAPFGKRSWKMFYCTLRDPLVMYLHKDERGFHKNQVRFLTGIHLDFS